MSREEMVSQNRTKLSELIYELRRFTLDQLYEAYTKKFKEDELMSIGDGWSIQDYLDYLQEIGVLKKDYEYIVRH